MARQTLPKRRFQRSIRGELSAAIGVLGGQAVVESLQVAETVARLSALLEFVETTAFDVFGCRARCALTGVGDRCCIGRIGRFGVVGDRSVLHVHVGTRRIRRNDRFGRATARGGRPHNHQHSHTGRVPRDARGLGAGPL
jgi:hypothetical protein